MALELSNTSLARKSEAEALDIISGADDQQVVKAGETFTGTILAFVVANAGTVGEVLVADTSNTDIVGSGAEGYLNISGLSLPSGAFFKAGKYSKGANWVSITAGTADIIAYYKYTKVNS